MRSRLLSYRSLFILYGTSVLVSLPFGGAYAYACLHGWDRSQALLLFLALGAIAALSAWAILEPRLLARQPVEMNFDAIVPQVFVSLPAVQMAAAVGVFVALSVPCSQAALGKTTTLSRGSAAAFKTTVIGERLQPTSSGTAVNVALA